jgi:hypothetical protein
MPYSAETMFWQIKPRSIAPIIGLPELKMALLALRCSGQLFQPLAIAAMQWLRRCGTQANAYN